MVSVADYEQLIRSGLYEAVEEEIKSEPVMKKVYGKKESPYKHHGKESKLAGPRQRIVLQNEQEEVDDEEYEWFDEDSLFETEEILEPFEQQLRITPSEGNEDGWSF